MIRVASSKHRSIRVARMWNSTSPGVATACRGPDLISWNGCSPAGRGPGPASRSHAPAPKPVTQLSLPVRSRNPTARSRPAMSPDSARTASALSSSGFTTATRKIAALVSVAITSCGSGAAAPSSGITRLSSTSHPRRRGRTRSCAKPAGDVEPEPAVRGHRAQAALELAKPLGTEGAGPLRAQILEYRGGPDQRVDAARREPDQLAPAVGGIGGALGVAQVHQPVDRLPGSLFGDAEPAAQFARGRAVRADRLHRKAVGGAHVRVALRGKLGVQRVDEGAKAGEQQQRQLEPRGLWRLRRCQVRQPGLLYRQPR